MLFNLFQRHGVVKPIHRALSVQQEYFVPTPAPPKKNWRNEGPSLIMLSGIFLLLAGLLASCEKGETAYNRRERILTLASQLDALQKEPGTTSKTTVSLQKELNHLLDADAEYPKQIEDKVELLAFAFKNNSNNEPELQLIFRCIEPMERDYSIYVYGQTDKAHHDLINQDTPERKSVLKKWPLSPATPTQEWSPGKIYIIRQTVQTPRIPYNISVNFLYKEPETGWRRMSVNHLRLGWYAPL